MTRVPLAPDPQAGCCVSALETDWEVFMGEQWREALVPAKLSSQYLLA